MLEHKLLDTLLAHEKLKNDAALALRIDVAAAVLSKIRGRKVSVSEGFKTNIIRKIGWPLSLIDELSTDLELVTKEGSEDSPG